MTMTNRKQAVRELLSQRDLPAIRAWASEQRSPLRTLMSQTFDSDELLCWRAVEAVGAVATDQAEIDAGRVREFIRRLLWLMNDESGGLAWHSPEMIGEILVKVPDLIEEYAPLLPSFLREEPFERGTHQAIWRVARVRPDAFKNATELLSQSLIDPDPAIRAYAAMALMEIDPPRKSRIEVQLNGDQAGFSCYDFDRGQITENLGSGDGQFPVKVGLHTETGLDDG